MGHRAVIDNRQFSSTAPATANSVFIVGENESILQSEPLYNSRLVNIATRGNVRVRRDRP